MTESLTKKVIKRDIEALKERWITDELAEQAGLYRVDSSAGSRLVGRNGVGDYAGIAIPNILPDETQAREYRLRRDNPDLETHPDGGTREKGKYLHPPGRGNLFYFVPGMPAGWLSDTQMPVVIVEGEFKALAVWRLSHHHTDAARFLPIGIPGCWNWRGTIGKALGPSGERRNLKGPIPDFDRVAWKDRLVYLAPDTNVCRNSSVRAAWRELARELERRGAQTLNVELPAESGINGVDDLLAKWGPERVLELFEEAKPRDEYVGAGADLKKAVRSHMSNDNSKKDYQGLAEKTFDWFLANGGEFFFHQGRKDPLLWFHGREYVVDSGSTPFAALLYRESGLVKTREPGRTALEVLKLRTINEGRSIRDSQWPLIDREAGTLCVPIGNDQALLISEKDVKYTDLPAVNGSVISRPLPEDKFVPIRWSRCSDPSPGLCLLKEKVIDNLACPPWGRYLAIAWSLSRLLMPDFSSSIIIRMGGESSEGKSTAQELVATFFFGMKKLEGGTAASLISDAQVEPLLFPDNLESDKVKTLRDFLLLHSQGTGRSKRQVGTDSGVVTEKPRAFVMFSSIEGFTVTELLGRTFEIPVDRKIYGRTCFGDMQAFEEIFRHRDAMWSAIFELFARDVLPEWSDNGLAEMREFIEELKPEFARPRALSHFSVIALILKHLVKYIPPYSTDSPADVFRNLLREILDQQHHAAEEGESMSNEVVNMFNLLAREFAIQVQKADQIDDFAREYSLRKLKAVFAGECVRFSFEASAGSLLTTFSRLSWEKRLHFSIGNPQTLAERCKDKTREILRAFGWERAPECRKIGGERFYRWEKVYDEN